MKDTEYTVEDFLEAGYVRCVGNYKGRIPNAVEKNAVYRVRALPEYDQSPPKYKFSIYGGGLYAPLVASMDYYIPATKEEYEKARIMQALE